MAECLEMAEEVVKKQMKMVEKIYGAPWRLRHHTGSSWWMCKSSTARGTTERADTSLVILVLFEMLFKLPVTQPV